MHRKSPAPSHVAAPQSSLHLSYRRTLSDEPNTLAAVSTVIRNIVLQAYVRATQSRALSTLIPKSVAKSWEQITPASAPRTTSRTASYDGLRGLACLVVFHFHFLYPYSDSMKHGFGSNAENRYILQLPIICLLLRGRAMVTLFFAISGYVLSYNFLASCREKQWDNAFSRLASLTLRRWLRLFLPATFTMMLVCIGVQLGFYSSARELQFNPLAAGKWEEHPPHFPDFRTQIKDFAGMWWVWSSPFRWDLNYTPYDPHTWTIPVELRCSLILFVFLVGSAGLKQRWRTGLTLLVATYCLFQNRWDVATFIGGALVADLHQAALYREGQKVPPHVDSSAVTTAPPKGSAITTTLKWLLLATSLYVLSFPDNLSKKTPGYRFLRSITPPSYREAHFFWHAFASSFVLWCVQAIPQIRMFLSSPIPQYLGKTSFALYLVHGPLLHSIGFNLQPKIWEVTGSDTMVPWCAGLFVGWLVMFPLSMMTAYVFYRFVDIPLVRLARYVESLARDETAFRKPRAEDEKGPSAQT